LAYNTLLLNFLNKYLAPFIFLLTSSLVYAVDVPKCSLSVRVDHRSNTAHIRVLWKNLPKADTLWFYYMPAALADKKSFFSREQDEYQNPELHFFKDKQAFELPVFTDVTRIIRHPTYSEVFGIVEGTSDTVAFTYTIRVLSHSFPISAVLPGGDLLFQFFYPQPIDSNILTPLNQHLYLSLPAAHYIATIETDNKYNLIAPGSVESEFLGDHIRWSVTTSQLDHFNFLLSSNLVKLPPTKCNPSTEIYDQIPNIGKMTEVAVKADELRNYIKETYKIRQIPYLKIADLTDVRNAIYPNGHWIAIKIPTNLQYLPSSLAEIWMESFVKGRTITNRWKYPIFYKGLSEFLKYDFLKTQYPELKLLGPLANTLPGRIFGLDSIPYWYQNQLIFLFTERQGLSQPLNDDYARSSRLHLDGSGVAKYVSALFHLKGYLGEFKFNKLMYEAFEQGHIITPEAFHRHLSENHHRPLDWFTVDFYTKNTILDYELLQIRRCNYTQVITVKNRGQIKAPIPISGIKDGEIFITQWFEGHHGTRKIPVHTEVFDRIIIDARAETPEINHHNNQMRTAGILRRLEPVKFQFYTGLEEPFKNQIYWYPMLNFNAYDRILLGISVYNSGLLLKKYEYQISPQFSTGTGKLTGIANFTANYPIHSGFFHMIRAGVYFKYFHYDQDLAFTRWSPTVRFWWRKSNPRSMYFHITRLRFVDVRRELPPDYEDLPVDISNASYGVFSLNHTMEYTSILKPTIVKANFEKSSAFVKVFGEWDQRWMLPNRRWLILRLFYGQFLKNNLPSANAFYNFGLSGTLDYNFDYLFYGRSDSAGIWSQQMFITDGGFRAATGVYASRWMGSINVSIPFWKFLGMYADAGWADGRMAYGTGIRLAFITDFVELYLPVFTSQQRVGANTGYLPKVRFLFNPDFNAVLQRIRRGWY
jgi:hypothetical protein